MFNLQNDEFSFTVSPFERVIEHEIDPVEHRWDWIKSWVEFSVSGLKVQFQTDFSVGELKLLREQFSLHYEALIAQREVKQYEFRSLNHQLNMNIRKVTDGDGVMVDFVLRPEPHADSVQVKGDFGLNESYFPDILKRLDEMIEWQN